MAKIIYKDGCESRNRLECIEGIEIDLLNGQKALVYPKYSNEIMLPDKDYGKWPDAGITEIEALRIRDNRAATASLLKAGSPAARFVSGFSSERFGVFGMPTLLAALEITAQKQDIDELAETIEGADLLRDFSAHVWSCSRYNPYGGWVASGNYGCADGGNLYIRIVAAPLVLLNAAGGAA